MVKQNGSNEGAALEDYSKNSGIAVTKFNGYTFDTSQSLTTPDNLFDCAPVITAGSGQAAVA